MKLSNGTEIVSIPDFSGISADAKALWLKWNEALRSGKYTQDRGPLRTATGFCCLGVASDVVKEDDSQWEPDEGVYRFRDSWGITSMEV